MKYSDLSREPLKLDKNRVWRPFTGGKLLDLWQGEDKPEDGNKAEEWVASTVEARNPETVPNEGLSRVILKDGSRVLLRDIIKKNPEAFLGEKHVAKYGCDMAVLVKVLDSFSRLLIQVHPDKNYASEIFNSNYGKTEAWYIIGGRVVNGEEPYVFLGFKPGITEEKWKELFEKQDIKGMEECLHKFKVKHGDVFFVEGGVPHAAGSGVFFIEVQEPTDYTMRTERNSPMGLPLKDVQLHQGVGFEKMFQCFHYKGYTEEDILKRWHLQPGIIRKEKGGTEVSIISEEYTPYFSMKRLEVTKLFTTRHNKGFCIGIVLNGDGKLLWKQGEMQIRQATELYIPAEVEELTWINTGEKSLDIILCYPPAN